ncbi:DUF4252 domain-containing protein [Gillisia sp. M10.2A]|uniref:DUF4252 domain-containing protein n=1 Tax=Gillisia lutea TaxID=2909668 RepID=A0ABS9EFW1_9FLAO|nr:DUF4252 domain-containing protein [Gillisia lutea]MCF4101770.1 DUF4252 domain-containing protein [Gillisia lutea]
MKFIKALSIAALSIGFIACNSEQSLQKYYVDNQDNKEFVAIDVPTSMFTNAESLDEEQLKTLETIKKINLLAIPKKAENEERIAAEKSNISEILKNKKYQLLMKYGGANAKMEVYYTGEEEAVDEVVVYGFDNERGVGIARVLGDNMKPGDILGLMRSLEKGDIDMDGLKGISTIFSDQVSK